MNRINYWLSNWKLLLLIFVVLFFLNLAMGRSFHFPVPQSEPQREEVVGLELACSSNGLHCIVMHCQALYKIMH